MDSDNSNVIPDKQAAELVQATLFVQPISIARQKLTQSGNAVFHAVLSDKRSVVLRVSPRPKTFDYTLRNLSALRELNMPVQNVLGIGSTSVDGSFILLNWIPGRDLLYELPQMRAEQMTLIAQTVVDYQKRIATLPSSSGFGWAPIGKNAPAANWPDIFGTLDPAMISSSASPLQQLRGRLRTLRKSLEPYFASVQPTCFLDDLTIKNILIENGQLTGIIDVDFVCYGDPLMSVGTTLALLAVDVGDAGRFYGEELVRCWNPSIEGRHAIQFYAALWTMGMLNAADKANDTARVRQLMPILEAMLPIADVTDLNPDQVLDLATQHHRVGNHPEARRLYQLLFNHPSYAVARFRMGLLELQEGNKEVALVLIEQAAAASPDEARYQFGLGETLSALGRFEKAAAAYRQAIAIDPRSADAHFALGNALQSQGDYPGAITAYQCATELQPGFAAAISNLGAALQATGEIDQAIELLRKAIALQPNTASHAINLGAALLQRREFTEAVAVLHRASQLDEKSPEAAYNLGNAYRGLGQTHEAAASYQKAIALRPDYADALINLGNVHKELGEIKQAVSAYQSAMQARPDSVVAVNNLGCLLRMLGRMDEAEMVLRRGLEIDAKHSTLHDNLGSVLKDAGRLEEAIDCFRNALSINPNAVSAHSNLAYALSFACIDAAPILEECQRWNTAHAAPLQSEIRVHTDDRSPYRRLRIGYVSPDFRDHCQSLFTIPLLSHHDHEALEIFCYSSVERPDDLTRRIAGYADVWREVRPLDDAVLSNLIREDRIDILVDLTMHMANGRPLLFARKPAPLQVAWLAYPGTIGISAIDYRFTDPRLDPPGYDSHYTERTIHLPDSFWCYDPLTDQPEVNDLPALARGYIILGCLNNPCKLTDHTLGLWGQVMHAIPNAKLLLMAPPGSGREHLLHRLAKNNIAADRVEFVPFRPRAEYLRTYHDIDLGLDTLPYNGHTTSLDSFWMGVPVITRVGQTSVGRGGLSQLFNLDLLQFAAATDEAFVKTAIEIAGNLPHLAALRKHLRQRLQQSHLMDADRFAKSVENAYRRIWKDHCK